MKTLGIFIHFNNRIHNYVKYYIQNLAKHCDEILFVTNLKEISHTYIKNLNKLKILSFTNEAYDFGSFYKAIHTTDISTYDRIIFANDSNILFSNLTSIMDWGNKHGGDYWGLTDSFEGVPGYKTVNTYHIQSPFLVFEKRAINLLLEFFRVINFSDFFNKNHDPRDLRLKIITQCEMGLTEYFKNKGLNVNSYFKVKEFAPKYTKKPYTSVNLHLLLWKELILNGMPFIKKKIVVNGFDPVHEPKYTLPDFSKWREVIKEQVKNESLYNELFNIK